MLRVGQFTIITESERVKLVGALARAQVELGNLEGEQAKIRTQQSAVVGRQQELLHEARRERDLAHARALEYQGLFVEQQAEIDSLQRQLSVAHHPSTQPRQDES